MRLSFALLTSTVILSACTPMEADSTKPDPTLPASAEAAPPRPAPPQGVCDAARVQNHLGHTLTPAMTEQIRTEAGATTVRVIAPGTMVTMDFREDRLNIEHDDARKITAIRCG